MKTQNVGGGIFGDIDLEPHREWVERVCKICGIEARLPLWEMERTDIIHRFVESGFRAIICAVLLDKMDASWLGRELDTCFIEALKQRPDIDLCGENGEYHTFVYDGPLFVRPVEFVKGPVIKRKNHAFLDLQPGSAA
jgi:uncharacterized protein (TIGR00290 family)